MSNGPPGISIIPTIGPHPVASNWQFPTQSKLPSPNPRLSQVAPRQSVPSQSSPCSAMPFPHSLGAVVVVESPPFVSDEPTSVVPVVDSGIGGGSLDSAAPEVVESPPIGPDPDGSGGGCSMHPRVHITPSPNPRHFAACMLTALLP